MTSGHRLERIGDGAAVHIWSGDEPSRESLPVLVAFHGRTDGGEVFGAVAERLLDVCDVVAPDAPGHGHTAWVPDGTRGYAALNPAALAAVDAVPGLLGPGRPLVLLGHSMGVHAVSHVVARRAGLVRHAVLEAPPRRSFFKRREVRWAVGGLQKLQAMDHEQRLAYLAGEVDWPCSFDHEVWARTKAQADLELVEVLGPWRYPLRTILRPIDCPVTVVVGRRDAPGWLRLPSRALLSRRRGVNVVELDAAHNPRREDAAGFCTALASVLSSVRSGTARTVTRRK